MPPRPARRPDAASKSSGKRRNDGSKPSHSGNRRGPGPSGPRRGGPRPNRAQSSGFAPPAAPEGRGVRGAIPADASKVTASESTGDSVQSDDLIRLQKFLAMAGVDSRRNCEEYIRTGRVTVDGEVVLDPARGIDPAKNDVRLDSERLRPPRFRYFLINKPKGVLCTNSDPQGRPRAVDLVPVQDQRLFTVGRLDENTEGLLLITNDGDLAQHLAHPKFEVIRRYRCQVAGIPTTETLRQLREGMYFSDGFFRFRSVHVHHRKGRSVILELELQEGKNREIRRLMARSGHKVLALERIGFGPLQLRGLGPGRHRELLPWEITELRRFAEHGEKSPEARPQRRDDFGYRPGQTRRRVPKPGLQAEQRPDANKPEAGRPERPGDDRRPRPGQRPDRNHQRNPSKEFSGPAIEIEVVDDSQPRQPRRPAGERENRAPRPTRPGRPASPRDGVRDDGGGRPKAAKSKTQRPAAKGKGKSSGPKRFKITGQKEIKTTPNAKGRDRRRER